MTSPLIIAGTPVAVNELFAADIAAGKYDRYEPVPGASQTACQNCSAAMWIGPKQREAVDTAPAGTYAQLCHPCAILASGYPDRGVVTQLEQAPLADDTRDALTRVLTEVEANCDQLGWDSTPAMWWVSAADDGVHLDLIPVPEHVWLMMQGQPHPILAKFVNSLALDLAADLVGYIRGLPGVFVGFAIAFEAWEGERPVEDRFQGRLRAEGLDADARELRSVVMYLNPHRIMSITRYRGEDGPQPVEEYDVQRVLTDRTSNLSAVVWALVDNLSSALGDDAGGVE